jgi:hypothetical protein
MAGVNELMLRGSPSAPPQFNLKKGNNVLLWKTMRWLDALQRRRSSKSELKDTQEGIGHGRQPAGQVEGEQ